MLMNLRNALMTGKRLPYDAEVEYLESTGTQWIDTGISGAEHNLIITARVRINTYGAYAGIFGNYVSETANSFRLLLTESNNGKAYANCGYRTNNSHVIDRFSLRNWHTVILNGAEDRCFCDGVEFTKGNRYIQGTANADTIKLFVAVASASGTWSKQISAFKVELNGVLVRDFIPVRKGTVGYLYDRVSGKLFGNEGTGDFVVGPDVVPVEYIESHGTEWIDTDIVAADDVGYELRLVDWQSLWPSTVNFIFAGVFGRSNPYGLGYTGRPNAPRTNVFMWWNSAFANLGTIGAISNGYLRFNFLNSRSYDFNGVISGSLFGSYNASNTTIRLLNAKRMDTGENAFPNSVPAKISAFKISKDNAPARSFRPVRVGTEGAMMDVLTRRIYRNAGTGAFGYGNDLKYPIPAE